MITTKEQSFLDTAEAILEEKKEPVDLYELFDMVVEQQAASSLDIAERLNAFYADITTSARFVYMGNNTWDLKRHQKIELWEKDGSFFNEYSEVEDELMDQRIDDQNKREAEHQAMLERREQALAEKAEKAANASEETPVVDDTPVLNTEDVIEAAEEVVQEVIAEDKVEETVESKDKTKDDADDTEEEYDGFDEEEYNEYMDEFEDKYDKK